MIFTPNETKEIITCMNENAINLPSNILNEAVQFKTADKILDKMFSMLVAKYNKVDFSEIEKSKGNITKFKYYANLKDCIETLVDISNASSHLAEADILFETMNNLVKLTKYFEMGFRKENPHVMMIYNIIGYALFEATSYVIASTIDFIKKDDKYEVDVYINNSKKALIIDSLEKFNKTVDNGTLTKYVNKSYEVDRISDEVLNESLTIGALIGLAGKVGISAGVAKVGLTIATVAALLYLGSHIIPLMRELVYCFYNFKHSISETAKIQAEFLEANIEVLKNNNGDEEVIAKQMRVVERLKNISRKFALDYDKTEVETKKDIKSDTVDMKDIVI